MITRFDHAIIAVRDLDEASERFRAAGFDVRSGGRHTGLGTHNALVRFGPDYLELISVHDAAEARTQGLGRQVLVDRLVRGEEGLVGYALAVEEIDALAQAVRRVLPSTPEPLAMTRHTPEGEAVSWRLVIPGGEPWLKPWPILIQWDRDDASRALELPRGAHPVGATGVLAVDVDVATNELALSRQLFREGFGLAESADETFSVGGVEVCLCEGSSSSGPAAITLAVADIDATMAALGASGPTVRSGNECRTESGWLPLDQIRYRVR